MSLSADEKLRVAHALDRPRHPLHRGRLPELQPEGGGALRAARATSASRHAQICAFGMTRRRDLAAARRPGARAARRAASRRSARWSGKTWKLHLEKVIHTDPEENLELIADSVALPARAGQARDLRRRALLRRLPRRPRLRAALPRRRRSRPGAENVTLCDTNGSSLPSQVADATRAPSSSASAASGSGSTPTTTRSAASPTRSPRSRRAPSLVQGTMNGIGERCGNANLVSILPALQLKLGLPLRVRTSSSPRSPRPRTSSTSSATSRRTRTSPTSAATPSPTRAACTSPACARTRARSSTSTRRWSATAASCWCRSCRARARCSRAPRRPGIELDADARRARGRAAEGARAPRLPLRGRGRLLRPAPAQGGGRLRAALPARELPRDHREARGRQGPDRGDDQDLGRAASGSCARPRATAR